MSKRFYAVLLTAGILLATGALVATVTFGPTTADAQGRPCSNVK